MFLRAVARRTWRFFTDFVGPADNWLPPDNYQEYPTAAVAHRTSPTNMGMALLANLVAHRLRLHRHRRAAAPHRPGFPDHGEARALSRPLSQLVRHPDAGAAASRVRLGRGQRQPGEQPAGAESGPAGAEEPAGCSRRAPSRASRTPCWRSAASVPASTTPELQKQIAAVRDLLRSADGEPDRPGGAAAEPRRQPRSLLEKLCHGTARTARRPASRRRPRSSSTGPGRSTGNAAGSATTYAWCCRSPSGSTTMPTPGGGGARTTAQDHRRPGRPLPRPGDHGLRPGLRPGSGNCST